MLLATKLMKYTEPILRAGERMGRVLEKDKRWFANHPANAGELYEAHSQHEKAFWALYAWIGDITKEEK